MTTKRTLAFVIGFLLAASISFASAFDADITRKGACSDASTTTTGCVTTSGQSFAGTKTFTAGDLVLYPDAGVNSGLCWGQDYDGTNTCITRPTTNRIGIANNGARSFEFSATAGTLYGTADTWFISLNNSVGAQIGRAGTDFVTVDSNGITLTATGATGIKTAGDFRFGTTAIAVDTTAPTIASGFGTSPSIAGSTTFSFRVTVGTGGTASTGALTMPTATTAWNCVADDLTTPGVNSTKMSASTTTSVTLTNYNTTTGAAAAWVAGDVIVVLCGGH